MVVSSIDLIFENPLDSSLQCPICGQALRSPMKLQCGHRFCEQCLVPDEPCRVCGRLGPATADGETHRRIQSLIVLCPYTHNGCPWRGQLTSLEDHSRSCEYRDMVCPNGCGEVFPLKDQLLHEEECGRRNSDCPFCHQQFSIAQLKLHKKVCPQTPMNCPNKCGEEGIPRGQLKDHLLRCPNAGDGCPFGEFGCEYAGGRDVLQRHIKEEPIRHLTYLCDGVIELKNMLAYMQLNTENMVRTIGSLEEKTTTLENMYGAQLIWRIEHVRQRQNEAKSGARSTIFSPPFMSARHGYKMALSACLYGDGQVRGKYLSVYVSILQGEFDPLLDWPFTHTVTLTLMDQNANPDNRQDIDYVIRPVDSRENKMFLDRPTSERNASFGAQKMCLLETLQSYIQDDVIFIKCTVDGH